MMIASGKNIFAPCTSLKNESAGRLNNVKIQLKMKRRRLGPSYCDELTNIIYSTYLKMF